MLSWATIEDALCDWFEYLSGMKPAQARSVFFSARSFAGRAAMLNALLSVPSGKPIVMEFVRAANDKCVAYNSIRNKIAHRIPIMDASDQEKHIAGLHEGGKHPFAGSEPISDEQLSTVAKNFHQLSAIMRGAWLLTKQRLPKDVQRKRLQEYLEQINLLPNRADSNEPSHRQLGLAGHQQSSRK